MDSGKRIIIEEFILIDESLRNKSQSSSEKANRVKQGLGSAFFVIIKSIRSRSGG